MKSTFNFVSRIPGLVFILTVFFFLLRPFAALPQCPTSSQAFDTLIALEKKDLPTERKLSQAIDLEKQFGKCGINKDSVYARLLHRIGLYNYLLGNLNEAILYTIQSAEINTTGKKAANARFAVNSYSNLAIYNKELLFFDKALEFYFRAIETAHGFSDSVTLNFVSKARLGRTFIYFTKGDYQKSIEEATLGLRTASLIKDNAITVDLLHERAQSYAFSQLVKEAIQDVNSASLLITQNNYVGYADNFKIKAKISEIDNRFTEAQSHYQKVIEMRIKSGNKAALAGDYLDAGTLSRNRAISDSVTRNYYYTNALDNYTKALKYARISGDQGIQAKALNNLGGIHFRKKIYKQAVTEYHESLRSSVPLFTGDDILQNPPYRQCKDVSDKNFLSLVLGNKTESLLYCFKDSLGKQYLEAAIKTATLTDSLITDMRHEQSGEQSKLHWRNETREFYSNAIEACYQANDYKQAFYFMEKSRAVLLNDKLNELGAFALLPSKEAAREQQLRLNILSLQIKLSKAEENQPAYKEQQIKLLEAKEEFERYIKTLQNNYPAYYQYKYADDVPDLRTLQKYLGAGGQSFVHYFTNYPAIYMLVVSPSQAKFIKLMKPQFNEELQKFTTLCSDLEMFKNNHTSFAFYANDIYKTLFLSLNINTSRIIICQDNFFIPFEALSTDASGEDFLISKYAFSYVYSARSLLKKFPEVSAKGDFLGVAPTSYASYLHLPELRQSASYLKSSADNYSGAKLMINSEANKENLMSQLPNYTIVNIYSHAQADSSGQEPVLFLSDSVLKLPELQVFNNTATQLVVLSACETSVGKNAAGEGVLSLARGFALAGIPSIAATLWKADENAIYNITTSFHNNLAHGMRKDDALQKAKLSFISSGRDGARLPFYWASLILAGNGDTVKLSNNTYVWLIIGGVIFIALGGLIIYKLLKGRKFV